MPAFQDALHAFQGTGELAFQVTPGGVVTTPQGGHEEVGRRRRVQYETVEIIRRKPPQAERRPFPPGALWSQYVREEQPKWVKETPPKAVAAIRQVATAAPLPSLPSAGPPSTSESRLWHSELEKAMRQREQVFKDEYVQHLLETRKAMMQINFRRQQATVMLLLMMV